MVATEDELLAAGRARRVSERQERWRRCGGVGVRPFEAPEALATGVVVRPFEAPEALATGVGVRPFEAPEALATGVGVRPFEAPEALATGVVVRPFEAPEAPLFGRMARGHARRVKAQEQHGVRAAARELRERLDRDFEAPLAPRVLVRQAGVGGLEALASVAAVAAPLVLAARVAPDPPPRRRPSRPVTAPAAVAPRNIVSSMWGSGRAAAVAATAAVFGGAAPLAVLDWTDAVAVDGAPAAIVAAAVVAPFEAPVAIVAAAVVAPFEAPVAIVAIPSMEDEGEVAWVSDDQVVEDAAMEVVVAEGVGAMAVDLGDCAICYENTARMTLNPCGHLGLCQTCCDAIMRGSSRCPFCSTRIISTLRIFPMFGHL
jgi:hypothetical protein